MGFLDNLKEIGEGAVDIISAPIGLIIDTARAVTSAEYNPGFHGTFTPKVEQLFGGFSKVGGGLQFDEAGRVIGESRFGDSVRSFIREGELIYNTEFQQQLGRAPLALEELGVQPGEVSLQRVGAAATGGVASALRADIPDVLQAWKRSSDATPGQALVEGLVNYHDRSRREQEEIRASAWYNMMSGTTDAMARWFTDPFVIGGKGIKKLNRQLNVFDPIKRYKFARKEAQRRYGSRVSEDTEMIRGVQFANLEEQGVAYAVMRNNTAGLMREEGSLKVPRGADPDLDDVIPLAGPVEGSAFLDSQSRHASLISGAPERTPQGVRYAGSDHRPVYLHSDRDAAMRYASELYKKDPEDVPILLEINTEGLPIALESIKDGMNQKPNGFFTLADRIPEENIAVVRPRRRELDPAERVGEGPQPWETDALKQVDETLYNPDGIPWEPDDIIHFEEFADDIGTALRLGAEDASKAEKFLTLRHKERLNRDLPEGGNAYDLAMNSRVVQRVLNDMDGKDPLSIRLEYFPNNPMGPMLGNMLDGTKTTYAERRTILMAAMGYKLPEFQTLPEITQGRLNNLLNEYRKVREGHMPEESMRAMMGERNRLNDMSPEGMNQAVEDAIRELQDDLRFQRVVADLNRRIPIQELRMPVLRRYKGMVRRTNFYQTSAMARPVRAIVENKPKQWINTRDPQSDLQIKRQMEEAAPLGVTKEEVDSIWRRFTESPNDQQKQRIVQEMEDLIITKAATKAGVTTTELDDLIRSSRRGRGQAQEYLTSRRYASGDKDVVPFRDPDTGELVLRPMPILSSQSSMWLPLQNVADLKRASSRFRRLRNKGVPAEHIMQLFNQIWKPTVLLRGGWPLRVVSDEQFRILALTGSLLKHIAAIEAGGVTKPTGIFDRKLTGAQRTAEAFALATGTRPLAFLGTTGAKVTAQLANKLGLYDPDYWKFIHEVGLEKFVSARAGYGGPKESTLHSMQALMGMDEITILDHLYDRPTGQWRTIHPGEREFAGSWARVLKDQFGNDPLGRKVVEELLPFTRGQELLTDAAHAQVVKNVVKWLKSDTEGKEVAARMPWRSNDLERWAQDLVEELDGYTAHFDDTLMDGVLNQKITNKMLNDIDERMRPDVVHGEIVDQALGRGPVVDYLRDLTSTSFDLLGRLPTDTLSRQPMFKQLYANEMIRLRDLHLEQGLDLTEDAIKSMSRRAREQSIITTRQYLYDLAEVSRFGHMMRFFMPFYPAWQEVLKVWGTLAVEDPSIIRRATLLWQAPNKADIVVKDEESGDEFMQFRLSERAADSLHLTGWQRFLATGGLRFGKSSFNLVLNSPLPSVGPLIQIPLNEIVKEKPELEETLKFILPFGVSIDSSEILTSPLIRSIKSLLASPQSDDDYQRMFANALSWMDVQFRSGERSTPVTLDEAHDVARKLTWVRLLARLASPAQPIFDSPLKPYSDVYRQLIEEHGPEDADEIFLNEFGQEYFAVTLSRTTSETGIPPTVEAEQARRKFEDLIQKHPEYGRLIIGDEALGEFSMAAFARQVTRPLDPEDPFSEPERSYRDVELDPRTGKIMEIDRRIGWQEYINAMDQLEIYRKQMGLPNLRVAEAEPLRRAKKFATEQLALQYPSWWEDFNTRDDLKWDDRINAFREISNNPALINRPDVDGLTEYLEVRSLVLQELNRRKTLGGSSTLDAVANQDLAGLWDQAVQQILDQNIAFVPLYYRYLEGDPVNLRRGPKNE